MREDQFAAVLLRFYLLFFTMPVIVALFGRGVSESDEPARAARLHRHM